MTLALTRSIPRAMPRAIPRARLAMALAITSFAALCSPSLGQAETPVTLIDVPSEKRIEIRIAGELFTAYQYGEKAYPDKPVFFPVNHPSGVPITRGFPMIRRVPGENRDHPHHQSLWFNYGDVNGLDFWNAYHKDLRIRHKHASIDGNTLRLELEWLEPDGAVLLTERRDVHFGGDIGGENGIWSMDHRITLTAGEKSVVFGDSKEGAFGLRLAASLRERDGTGRYLNAEGLETSSEVWGKPSAWVALTGEVAGGEGALDTTVAIFSHPTSLNHPPYWHARNYGLFAANPFGRKGYDRAAERRETRVEPGQSIRMRYLLVVADRKLDGETLNEIFTRYSTD